MSQTEDYQFEMFGLRKQLLALVAECARDDDLRRAKREGASLIRRNANGDADQRRKAAKAFKSSFDRAVETVNDGGDYDLEIADFPSDGILTGDDHDAEIDPTREIDGSVAELITSIKRERFSTEKTTYPVIDHPSEFRICTCGAQKYYIVCPHTLARVIERNWANAPLPA